MHTLHLDTPAEGFLSVTRQVTEAVAQSGVEEGVCVVYCPHTTAGITINEDADPDVKRDLLLAYDKAFPDRSEFHHFEGNSAAHAKTSAVGPSVSIPITGGRLALGRWQGIYFCEFDGPRQRRFFVQVLPC